MVDFVCVRIDDRFYAASEFDQSIFRIIIFLKNKIFDSWKFVMNK